MSDTITDFEAAAERFPPALRTELADRQADIVTKRELAEADENLLRARVQGRAGTRALAVRSRRRRLAQTLRRLARR